jgi:hypothetical protein
MTTFDPHSAATVPSMLSAIRLDGQPPEAEWPYIETLPSDLSGYKPPANITGIINHSSEDVATFDFADEALRAGMPVLMAIGLSRSFYGLIGDSILPADADVRVMGYHAILGVGIFSSSAGEGYLIRNSWGVRWGLGGYGLITRAYLEPRKIFLGVFRA